jgi:hypothetical protein
VSVLVSQVPNEQVFRHPSLLSILFVELALSRALAVPSHVQCTTATVVSTAQRSTDTELCTAQCPTDTEVCTAQCPTDTESSFGCPS